MGRETNFLPIWGNKDSMNLNSMILTNIQSSTYFKQRLYELKTYHEVIDEIYYRVRHLEPWEKGSRRTQGLTGMCGGVRGVGGGGIVSTAFCILYKLYTLKLTRKQVIGLTTHQDSPYIRALGFMYLRYTQNPQDLYNWFCDYLDDEEEIDVKAGGGLIMTIGQMLRQWLTRLEWFDTLFPRIPVPIQKEIMDELRARYGNRIDYDGGSSGGATASKRTPPPEIVEALRNSEQRSRGSRSQDESRSRSRTRSRNRSKNRNRSESRERKKSKSKSRERSRSLKRRRDESESKTRKRHHKSRSSESPQPKSKSRSRSRSSSNEKRDRHHHHHHHHSRHKKSSKERDDKDERKRDKEKEKSSKEETKKSDRDVPVHKEKDRTSKDKERHKHHRNDEEKSNSKRESKKNRDRSSSPS